MERAQRGHAGRHAGLWALNDALRAACRCLLCLALAALAACGTTTRRDAPLPPTTGGGYYLDDGPGAHPPKDLDSIPDAVPRLEPINRGASRPYTVMGRYYVPMTHLARYKTRGKATWYGRRYHGKPTSSGETYDMYAMTAAHTTLPIPSYVRVTSLANGRSVVVRVNDRGPFIGDRLIDLSYTAAYKLGLIGDGSGMVEVEMILPGDPQPAATAGADTADVTTTAEPVSHAAPAEPTPAALPLETAASAPSSITPVAAEKPAAASQPATGVYLQFGAFRSRENAESLLNRLKLEMEWLAARLHVAPREGLYRVHAGPYVSPAEARETASRINGSAPQPVILRW